MLSDWQPQLHVRWLSQRAVTLEHEFGSEFCSPRTNKLYSVTKLNCVVKEGTFNWQIIFVGGAGNNPSENVPFEAFPSRHFPTTLLQLSRTLEYRNQFCSICIICNWINIWTKAFQEALKNFNKLEDIFESSIKQIRLTAKGNFDLSTASENKNCCRVFDKPITEFPSPMEFQ